MSGSPSGLWSLSETGRSSFAASVSFRAIHHGLLTVPVSVGRFSAGR